MIILYSYRPVTYDIAEYNRVPLTREEEERSELLKFYRGQEEEKEKEAAVKLEEMELVKPNVNRVAMLKKKFA